MKKDMSAFEINAMVKELQVLAESKIVKIFMPSAEEIAFQLYSAKNGKNMLMIRLPSFIFIATKKSAAMDTIHGFCAFLRKKLTNSFLMKIEQINFERIIRIKFNAKDQKYNVYVELFSKGNIIVCDEEDNILSPLKQQSWSSRIIKAKEKYKLPEKRFNLLDYETEELKDIISKSEKKNIASCLASELGLGGNLSEEILMKAKADKGMKPTEVKAKVKDIDKALKEIVKKKISPVVVKDKDGKFLDITTFEFEIYKDHENVKAESISNAIDDNLEQIFKVERKQTATEKKKEKIILMIKSQEERAIALQKEAEENNKIGEIIYNNYQKIDEILKQLKTARKTMNWSEIKEKTKGHKIIKEINDKDGKIVVEIE